MNVRCNYCQTSFNLNREFMAQAVEEAKGKKHVAVDCIKCRKSIKVPIKQMKRYLPKAV